MNPIRIFIIDDSQWFISSVEMFLKTFPEVEVVATETDSGMALERLPRLKVDVILMDLVMPDIDGLEFLKLVKRHPGMPLVVIMTLFNEPFYRHAAEVAEADGFVPKTELGTQLMPLIYKLMGREILI